MVTPDDRIGTIAGAKIRACPDCDLLQILPEVTPGRKAKCARCGHLLATYTPFPIERPLALSITALLVLIIANTAPLMGLSVVGRQASTTIVGGAYQMWLQGQEFDGNGRRFLCRDRPCRLHPVPDGRPARGAAVARARLGR